MFKYNIEKNNRDHHTDEISLQRLIVRRGQPFQLTFYTKRQLQPDTDTVHLVMETGPSPSEAMGTSSTLGFPWRVNEKSRWKVELLENCPSYFTMGIKSPADASVGSYKLSIRKGLECTPQPLANLVLLFNPWCTEDWVYLPGEDERKEYVMAEDGIIYRGSDHYISSLEWNYGQFEEDMVDICLKLLDMNPKCLRDAAEDFSARCNPIYVGRVVSAMINANDDHGVLEGCWSPPYVGGKAPTYWDDSVDILRLWNQNQCRPVKYGQCWVFAAVMCTVLRCLGIPCRVVTNFQSGHDTDKSLTIDKYYTDNGLQPKDSRDSVWNYHVWVEGWMKRPDLSKDSTYDGWQVMDPTPQERSEGVHCCGPCPVKAVLEGHTDLKYDVPFIFAEVNADQVSWMVMADGSKRRMFTDSTGIGRNISTKAVGADRREDITAIYKYSEGSQRERCVFDEAVRRSNLTIGCGGGIRVPQMPQLPQKPQLPQQPPQVKLRIGERSPPIAGTDLELYLSLFSDHSDVRQLSVFLSAQTMRYTGVPDCKVWNDVERVKLQPRQEHTIPILIPYFRYGAKMQDNNSLKVTAIVHDQKHPDELYMAEVDIVPQRPTLTIECDGSCEQYSVLEAKIIFHNPLSVALKNCSISVTGSGLLTNTVEVKVADIGVGECLSVPMQFKPYRAGRKMLLVDFDCDIFQNLKACHFLDIRPYSGRNQTGWCGVSDNTFYGMSTVCHYSSLTPRMVAMTVEEEILIE
ncbi:hypothetical protein ACEWY4_026103 [Coilia grayii]|uniref:Protein-glutamine gamma-glutamyltransferase 2 n=1 Tax=Coilia grayii TaxID=363190 RepID=A0ABD1ITW9_9TELE